MAKIVDLSKGFYALVDDEDFELVSQWAWSFSGGYARRHSRGHTFSMHRQILDILDKPGIVVDHINGDGLDNRKANLRVGTQSDNMSNRGLDKSNTTGFKGVCLDKRRGLVRYRATIHHKNKYISLGVFDTAEEAAVAYDKAATELFGQFAYPNKSRKETA